MTLSSTFLTAKNGTLAHPSGQTFAANSNGLVTVNAPADGGVAPSTGAGASIVPVQMVALFRSGTTSDRLSLNPSAANGGVGPPFGQCFNDSTLSAFCWYVGTALSSTGWVSSSGVAV